MSKFGIQISNVEAAIVYEYNKGLRDSLDPVKALFSTSLLSDFLLENGLKTKNNKSTQDIVCVCFDFGCASYEENVKRVKKQIKNSEDNEYRLEKYKNLLEKIEKNKDLYEKISAQELREIFYTDGFSITYDKGKSSEHTINYKMFYRTPGKAKQGSVMFINEELYEKAINFIRMGIQLPEQNARIVEISAYSSLIASSIVDRIQIRPEEILVLKDVDSFINKDAISVELDDDGHCTAKEKENYRIKSTLFDGQALIDSSIFPEWGNGYVLLRHHFCKCAAFSANIQLFFQDYFGNGYQTATLKDMFGREVRVRDIKLITTDNAMKWLKLGVGFDYWADWVRKNGSLFGVVKTAHESKIGTLQRMSYQMVNSLDMSIMDSALEMTDTYVRRLKEDDEFFKDHLRKNINYSNDYDVLLALLEKVPEFVRTDYFKTRRWQIIGNYISLINNGRILQNADNLVIVGSPYGMLLHAVGEDPLQDPTFQTEESAIQCWTERFEDGEYLAEFRSPFNSRNNLGYMHNVCDERFLRYFNFGKQIIAVNMVGTDFQDRNNGLMAGPVLQKCSSKTIQ